MVKQQDFLSTLARYSQCSSVDSFLIRSIVNLFLLLKLNEQSLKSLRGVLASNIQVGRRIVVSDAMVSDAVVSDAMVSDAVVSDAMVTDADS